MMGWNNGMGWDSGWGMMGGGLFMLLITIIAILLIVWLVRALSNTSNDARASDTASRQTPMEILQERFARGEIDEEGYQQRRRHLSDT